MDAAEFHFLLAIAGHGRAPDGSGDRVMMYLRRGLIVREGRQFRLTPEGQRTMMDGWTRAIVDALGVCDRAVEADAKPEPPDQRARMRLK